MLLASKLTSLWEELAVVQRHSLYAPEFRRGSARYVLEYCRLIAEIAKEIGVSATTLRKWRNRELEFPHLNDKNSYGDLLAENARLRRELEVVRSDKELF